jgi:NADH:ubiquinone oxidoreductase subunit B-like Fe-S oxidoreductase
MGRYADEKSSYMVCVVLDLSSCLVEMTALGLGNSDVGMYRYTVQRNNYRHFDEEARRREI